VPISRSYPELNGKHAAVALTDAKGAQREGRIVLVGHGVGMRGGVMPPRRIAGPIERSGRPGGAGRSAL